MERGPRVTARDLATVALRVLGIVYLVNAFSGILQWVNVRAFRGIPGFVDTGTGGAMLQATTLVHAAVLGTLGLAFLVNTKILIRWLFPELGDGVLGATGKELHRLAFAVVGVIIAASAAPGAVAALLELFWYLGGERRHLFADVIGQEWIGYSQAVLGVVAGVVVYELAPWLASRVERRKA